MKVSEHERITRTAHQAGRGAPHDRGSGIHRDIWSDKRRRWCIPLRYVEYRTAREARKEEPAQDAPLCTVTQRHTFSLSSNLVGT